MSSADKRKPRLIKSNLSPVMCRDCGKFLPNEASHDPGAMGRCREMEDWKQLYADKGRRPSPEAYEAAWKKLGDKLCWPNVERFCTKFVGVAK